MIETIEVNNVATYAETQILSNLKKVNFIYGTNGSGKTTISRILDNPNIYPNCNIKWKDNNELPILVYNKDFVNEHFSESKTLKGVFTLGKNSIELQRLIEEKRNLINSLIGILLVNNYTH
jgi:wobble nucleotide-excising tRNase